MSGSVSSVPGVGPGGRYRRSLTVVVALVIVGMATAVGSLATAGT